MILRDVDTLLAALGATALIGATIWLGWSTPAVGADQSPGVSYWTGLIGESPETRPACETDWQSDSTTRRLRCDRLAHPPPFSDDAPTRLDLDYDAETDRIEMLHFRIGDFTPPLVSTPGSPGRLMRWSEVVDGHLGLQNCVQVARTEIDGAALGCDNDTVAHLRGVDSTGRPVAHLWIGDDAARVLESFRSRATQTRRQRASRRLAAATDYLAVDHPAAADRKLADARRLLADDHPAVAVVDVLRNQIGEAADRQRREYGELGPPP